MASDLLTLLQDAEIVDESGEFLGTVTKLTLTPGLLVIQMLTEYEDDETPPDPDGGEEVPVAEDAEDKIIAMEKRRVA